MRREKGFTLIELLIVLAILGILVGIVAMSVGDLNTTANQRNIKTNTQIANASSGNCTVIGSTLIIARAGASDYSLS